MNATPDAQAETPPCADPRDCCRELTRVWKALGITSYTGKSASEEVAALQARLQPKAETPDRIAEIRQREQPIMARDDADWWQQYAGRIEAEVASLQGRLQASQQKNEALLRELGTMGTATSSRTASTDEAPS